MVPVSTFVRMTEEHYLELSENPVQFEHASSVNNVFFDEANKQVSYLASIASRLTS